MGFHLAEDFNLRDEQDKSYFLNIETHSCYTHGHARIMEDKAYHVLLNGNKHFVTAPPLRNFRFEMDFSVNLFNCDFGYGFIFYFRYDRKTGKGHTFEVAWSGDNTRNICIDGINVSSKKENERPDLSKCHAALVLKEDIAEFEFMGEKASFPCPDRPDLPQNGEVGFDVRFAPGGSMTVYRFQLDSDDELPVKPIGKKIDFELAAVQGCSEPIRFSTEIRSYGGGYAEIECVLDGTIRGRGKRIDSGGAGWTFESDQLTRPYIRIETQGREYKNILFHNGMMLLRDPEATDNASKLFPSVQWPQRLKIVCSDFPEEFIVAAGYEHIKHKPWGFVENGPYEQIRDMNGNFIYEGDSLRGRDISILVKSPEDKLLTKRIPENIPQYDRAMRHAKMQHYFYDSETVSFQMAILFRKEFYTADMFSMTCELHDPYGEKISGYEFQLSAGEMKSPAGFLGCIAKKLVLGSTLKSGVYHLQVCVKAGFKTLYDDFTVFEILPEDPDALPPPLASGLPMLLSMNNEVKNLETDAFDPLNDWGGAGHYYSMVMRYPLIGKNLRIWEILKVYHRKWFLMLTRRNTNDTTLSESNIELIKHADYLDMSSLKTVRTIGGAPYLCFNRYYAEGTLLILKDFILEKKVDLKLTTVEKIEKLLQSPLEESFLSLEQFAELVEKVWDQWIDFFVKRMQEQNAAFVEKLLAINPKIARACYGPYAIYAATYKSAYSVRIAAHGQQYDPVTNANGSFFFLEDYHVSCNYPLGKGPFFVASYKLLYPGGRKLYPEIYYGSLGGCHDGAVYQAHPPHGAYSVKPVHQRQIVYAYTYASPYYKDGRMDYWRDYGFHCPSPGKKEFRQFLYAWGKMLRNQPATQLSAPFIVLDPVLLRLHGDFYEDACSFCIPGFNPWTDISNTAEEAMAFSYLELSTNGFNTSVLTLAKEIASLTKEKTPFLVLPPIVKGTPAEIIQAIRAAHERGIGLLVFESAVGLEDLFGVRERKEPVNITSAGGEAFHHKCANALYDADGATPILYGAEHVGEKETIPLVLTHRTKFGRTAFFNIPPTVVRRENYRQKFGSGRSTLSVSIRTSLRQAAEYLVPEADVRSERGAINACISAHGDVIVTLSEDSPYYGDTTVYPVSFRFRVAYPGIDSASIEADAPYSVICKEPGSVVILTETEKDTAHFFKFKLKR